MTEKRFEIRQEDIDCDYLDLEGLISCIKCDGEFITYAEILNLLNKLSEENEELKKENKKLADALTVYFESKTIEPNYDAH